MRLGQLGLDLLALRAGGRLGLQVDLEGRLIHLGIIGPSLRGDQVDGMRRVVGTSRSVLAGAVSAIANHALNRDADVFLNPLDGRQQVLTVTAGGGHIGHIQDQLALGLDGDRRLEAIETLRLALAAMPHLWIGDADDPIRGRAFTDLRARRVRR